MKIAVNLLVVLGIVPLLVLGVIDVFLPLKAFSLYGMEPLGIMSFSTLRGAIGGMLFGGALMMILGLFTQNRTWFQAAFLLVFTILICRFVSVMLDGWTNDLLPAIITETYIVVVVFVASRLTAASQR